MALGSNNAVIVQAPIKSDATNATNAFLAEGLRDIKEPVHIPPDYTWLWISLGVLAALLLLAWLWQRFYNPKAKPAVVRRKVPAYRIALDELQVVLQRIHEPEPFCTGVSDIARKYLEGQFKLRAPDRATEEFLHELTASDKLNKEQKDSLARFLEQCDLVKFAKYEPTETELRDLHGAALQLVEETMPVGEERRSIP
ncbi:MAG: hypothetical protein ACJASX_003430 [Limisphaerales bacterium]|jgi:hypothetical protein